MQYERVAHLQMIQGVISRMAQNSFAIKNWLVILLSALIAIAAKEKSREILEAALFPTLLLWGLDGYYLRQERLFRKLYEWVCSAGEAALRRQPYTMNTKSFIGNVKSWFRTCFSVTVWPLYFPGLFLLLGAICWMKCSG